MKRARRKPVDPAQAVRYHRVAAALLRSALDLQDLAVTGDAYGNALAIVAIHAAIAYGNAMAIAFGGYKSTEGEHLQAVEALQDALGARTDERMLKLLRRIIQRKDLVSYQGTYYTVEDARLVVADLAVFAQWAEALFARKP